MAGTIVFVHGTGVRLKEFRSTLAIARNCAERAGVTQPFVDCAWGDLLGVEFEGKSLPQPPSDETLQEEADDFAQWQWRFDDPLFELESLTIRAHNVETRLLPRPGQEPEWELLWETVITYQPTPELKLLLGRGGLETLWQPVFSAVVFGSEIPKSAFQASAHELAEASHALARALIAQLHVFSVSQGLPGPSRMLRKALTERIIDDWGQQVYGLGTFFYKRLQRLGTTLLRRHREGFSTGAALPIGDVLLYQSRGQGIRDYIRGKVAAAEPPVTVVAHSLGGIACVDLFALPNPPTAAHLITLGSQAPLLYELGALLSLKRPQELPPEFPRWLNLFDLNDFLSYVAHRLFPAARDFEVKSGQAFPESHSAYFSNAEAWQEIRDFISP